ncbi:MAG TPA: Gfo/Idh/MocA family oxidoreductase [Armatimonadota bacterium]|nr:Gfo/Idh/MocA family oxidoreductase [Armatimonadota bacterium]
MSQIDASIRTLNVGVIGCGMLASTTHIPNSAANPGLNLRWLCDINAPLLREQAERYGVEHTTADYHALLQDPALDLVVLATTHTLRAEAIEAAARAGKAVYVEKPMAGSTQDVARILTVVRETGIPFCVGHNRRSAPAIMDAADILRRWRANPAIPPWRFDRNSTLRPRLPEEDQTCVMIRVNDDVLTWKPWAFADGAIINEMTHFIDLANLFMGELRPVEVYTMGSARFNFTIIIRYEDGSLATLPHSAVGTLDYPKELVEITCGGAMIAIDHCMEIRVTGIADEPFRRVYASPDPRAATQRPGIEGFYDSAQQLIQERLREGRNDFFIGGPDKGHYQHLDRFAACVRGDGPSPCDAEEAAKSTMLVLKAYESCRLGMPLPFGPDEYLPIAL